MKGEPVALPRRFYTAVSVRPDADGFVVLLDARQLRTPAKAVFTAPTEALAQLCAAEWASQGEFIQTSAMPITRLMNVALDRAPDARAGLIDSIAGYALTDLVCYRAPAPEALVALQAAAWDPLIAWAKEALGATLAVAEGLAVHPNNAAAASHYRMHAEALDDVALTGLAHAVGTAGSGVVGFALLRGRLDGQGAFAAATVDDQFQLARWGEDAEARARLTALESEFAALDRFFRALGQEVQISP